MYKALQKQIKELKEKAEHTEAQNKECMKEIEKLKTLNTAELEGINNKLSDFAQHAIENSKGPVKTEELLEFFKNDNFGKRNKAALDLIGNYSKNIDGVKKQLSQILETIQNHMAYRKKQKELDDKFIKTLKKLEKTIEKEEENGIISDRKVIVQSPLEQYFGWGDVSYKSEIHFNKNQNSSIEEGEQINTSKQGISGKEGKYNRKRKTRTDDDSSSSQGTREKHNRSRPSKRLKLSSSKGNTESSNGTEYMSVQNSDDHTEPMSVSSERSQSSTQPMSISESSQSDAMSVDESTENIQEGKTAIKGKNSKQSEENGDVETVAERCFNLRGRPL